MFPSRKAFLVTAAVGACGLLVLHGWAGASVAAADPDGIKSKESVETRIGRLALSSALLAFREVKRGQTDELMVGFTIVDGNKLLKHELVHQDEASVDEAIRTYARLRFPDSKATSYFHDLYTEGGVVHGVTRTLASGQRCYVGFSSEQQTVVYEICSIPQATIPVPVHLGLRKRYPNAQIIRVFHRVAAERDSYYFRILNTDDNTEYEVFFNADGSYHSEAVRIPAEIWIMTNG